MIARSDWKSQFQHVTWFLSNCSNALFTKSRNIWQSWFNQTFVCLWSAQSLAIMQWTGRTTSGLACLACFIIAASLPLRHPQHVLNKAVFKQQYNNLWMSLLLTAFIGNCLASRGATLFLSHTHPRGPPSLYVNVLVFICNQWFFIHHQFCPSAFQSVGLAHLF